MRRINIKIENRTGMDIFGLYVAVPGNSSWSTDILENTMVENGGDIDINYISAVDSTIWNWKVDDGEGKEVMFYNIDFAECTPRSILVLCDDGTSYFKECDTNEEREDICSNCYETVIDEDGGVSHVYQLASVRSPKLFMTRWNRIINTVEVRDGGIFVEGTPKRFCKVKDAHIEDITDIDVMKLPASSKVIISCCAIVLACMGYYAALIYLITLLRQHQKIVIEQKNSKKIILYSIDEKATETLIQDIWKKQEHYFKNQEQQYYENDIIVDNTQNPEQYMEKTNAKVNSGFKRVLCKNKMKWIVPLCGLLAIVFVLGIGMLISNYIEDGVDGKGRNQSEASSKEVYQFMPNRDDSATYEEDESDIDESTEYETADNETIESETTDGNIAIEDDNVRALHKILMERRGNDALENTTVEDYDDMILEVEEQIVITDEVFQAELDTLLTEYAYTFMGRVAYGKTVNITYAGFLNGELFEGGSAECYELTVGSGTFIDGFEEQLIGMSVGESKTINVTFPEESNNTELAGETVQFKVTVNAIVLDEGKSEFTNQWVSLFLDMNNGITIDATVEAFSNYYRNYLEESAVSLGEENKLSAVADKLYSISTVSKSMSKKHLDFYIDVVKESIENEYQMTIAEYIETEGLTQEEFDVQIEEMAIARMEYEFAIMYIGENEGIIPTEKEYTAMLQSYADQSGMSVEEFRRDYQEHYQMDIYFSLYEEKVLKSLLETATIR